MDKGTLWGVMRSTALRNDSFPPFQNAYFQTNFNNYVCRFLSCVQNGWFELLTILYS